MRQFPFEYTVLVPQPESLRACLVAAEGLCGDQDKGWTTRWGEEGGVVFCFNSEDERDAFRAFLSIAQIQ